MASNVAQIIEALGRLGWPVLVGVVLWKIYPALQRVLDSRAFTIKVGEFQVTVQDATEQLRATIEDLQQKVSQIRAELDESAVPTTGGVAGRQARAEIVSPPAPIRPVALRSVLWVDDKPEDKAYYITQLRSEAIRVLEVRSTREAIDYMASSPDTIGIVISNMGRWEGEVFNHEAGLELIKSIREEGGETPVLVFAGKSKVARYHEAVLASGGNGITWSPVELFEIVHRYLPSV
jgi:CheY-like chemotaxis protein